MRQIVTSPIFFVTVTILCFAVAQHLYQRLKWPILNPVLVSIVLLIGLLQTLQISYPTYQQGGQLISFLLGPAVVALGVPLYLQLETLRQRRVSLFLSILAGSLVGIGSGIGMVLLMGGSETILLSIAPRSVTTPIAIGIAKKIGGIESLTAAFVVSTGILGAVFGPLVLRLIGIRSRSAIGLALGAASHGIGTARALEEGELEGASAGLAIGLMGIGTSILTPLLIQWFL